MVPQIDWNDAPPPNPSISSADLRRCPPGGMPPAIVLSDWLTGSELHWWNGRSFPHLKNDCPACAAKRAKVWKGYIACLDPKNRKVFILELTPNCTEPLSAYKLTFGSLRGGQIRLDRSATKINGRVTATMQQANLGGADLPTPPDIRAILEHMWQTDHRPKEASEVIPRAIAEKPMSNEELRRRHPERFTTEGTGVDKVYEASEQTLQALQRNRERLAAKANANGNGQH